MIVRWSGQQKVSEVSQVFFFENDPPENHENTTFRTFLEPWGPRDRPWIQEHKILFRIALTRALYDQMAPQLCPFYVPGSGPLGGLSGKIWIWRPQREDLDLAASAGRFGFGGLSGKIWICLLYTSPSPRDQRGYRMPSSA